MSDSKFLQRLRLHLPYRPLIAATLVGSVPLASQLKLVRQAGIDVIEVRLDTFPDMFGSVTESVLFARSLLKIIRRKCKCSVLITLRSYKELGSTVPLRRRLSDSKRWDILKQLIPLSDAVDIEIKNLDLARKITDWAHSHRVAALHSFHNFKQCPKLSILKRMLEKSHRLNGDLFKLAVRPKTDQELQKFLSWGKTILHPKPVLIAMGPVGTLTRFIGFSFGSVMTYGHLGRSAAPGQVPVRDLVRCIKDIYRD